MEAETLLTQLEERKVTTLDLVALRDAVGAEDGKRLEVRLTKEPPTRQETPPRAHAFHDAEGLAEYLRRYGSAATTVYLDAPNGKAAVVLDEESDNGAEVLTLAPQVHPRWRPWKEIAERGDVPLEEFVDFLRDHRKSVKQPESRGLVLSISQIKASTEVTLHRGQGNKALNGLLIKTRITGGTGAGSEDVVDLPERITVSTPIYVGDHPRDVELDVILDGSADGRSVTVRIASADAKEAEIEAFERIEHALREAAKEKGYAVVAGAPSFGRWAYNG